MNPQSRFLRMQPIRLFQFFFILIAAALGTVTASVSTSAQMARMSSGITIRPRTNPVPLNAVTEVVITLPNDQMKQSKVSSEAYLTITLTTLSDLASAKKIAEWKTNKESLEWESLVLKATRDGKMTNEANVIQGVLPAGRTSFTLKVSSERGGALNLYVEGAGYGSTTINVLGPSQLDVAVKNAPVRAGREAQLELSLLDYQRKSYKADKSIPVTVTVTTLENLNDARQTRTMQARSLEKSLIALPKGGTTARLSAAFPAGKDRISLRFRTDGVGVVRIFVESVGLPVGTALISAIAQSNTPLLQSAPNQISSLLLPASYFQPTGPGMTTLPTATQAVRGRLQINRISANAITDATAGSYEFNVTLGSNSSGEPVPPTSPLVITFENDAGGSIKPTFYPPEVFIPAGSNSTEKIRVSYGCKGRVGLVAKAGIAGVEPSDPNAPQAVFNFSPLRRAGKLDLKAYPNEELADGKNPITLMVKVLDTCEQELKGKDESLDMDSRIVEFRATPTTVRFEEGFKLEIPRDASRAEKKVYPVSFGKVDVTAISTGEMMSLQAIRFYFPSWQILCAFLGGLICCPLICLALKQVPLLFNGSPLAQGVSWVSIFGVSWGVLLSGTLLTGILGGAIYGLLFYGALSTSDPAWDNSWSKTILSTLARLSPSDYFASGLIGLLGGGAAVVGIWVLLKWRQKQVSTT